MQGIRRDEDQPGLTDQFPFAVSQFHLQGRVDITDRALGIRQRDAVGHAVDDVLIEVLDPAQGIFRLLALGDVLEGADNRRFSAFHDLLQPSDLGPKPLSGRGDDFRLDGERRPVFQCPGQGRLDHGNEFRVVEPEPFLQSRPVVRGSLDDAVDPFRPLQVVCVDVGLPAADAGDLLNLAEKQEVFMQLFIYFLALGDVAGDREDDLLSVHDQHTRRHQSDPDLPALPAETRLEVLDIAGAHEGFDHARPLLGVAPDAEVDRAFPDRIRARVARQFREPLVDVEVHSVRQPVEIDRIGAGLERQAELLLGLP